MLLKVEDYFWLELTDERVKKLFLVMIDEVLATLAHRVQEMCQ